ncbi:MAG: DUF1631 domain-containing protein [Gammaproteobacteria bacterium]|nr:DUF1631 domain-containing protein [Gammaproteobacteria bacterium]
MATKTLQFIDMLFVSLKEDSSIPQEIKPYLIGLRSPVIKISSDKKFFSDRSHPARITLLLLTKISSSKENLKDLSINISKITDSLIHVNEVSLDDFIIANRKLLTLIDETDKNEVINNYEIKDKQLLRKDEKDRFKQKIITELQKVISNNSIPILAHELTLKIWPQFMYKKCYKKDIKSEYWVKGIDYFRIIIEYLQPIEDISKWTDINDNRLELIKSIHEFLSESDIDKKRITINTEALKKAISVNLNKFKHENNSLFEKQALEDKSNKYESILNELPGYVKVGEWFDLYTSEKTAANRLKLSLIIKEQGQLVFVDHRGIKGMVKDIDAFAEELSRFLSKPVNSSKPKFVDTWNELIEKIPKFRR